MLRDRGMKLLTTFVAGAGGMDDTLANHSPLGCFHINIVGADLLFELLLRKSGLSAAADQINVNIPESVEEDGQS